MIHFKGVSKIYPPDIVALRNVNLHIRAGEFVSIVGRSGTGKTTLAKLMIAEERPTKGSISIGNWDVTHARAADVPLLRRQIGVVFQDFKLLPQKTVFENVAFALEVCGAAPARIAAVVPQVLRIVGIEHKAERYPRELSGGEKQRVVIARALVHGPKILVADEPTGNLDTINTREVIDLLCRINDFGTTVVLVTHNREVVNSLRKRVVTLDHGQVVSDHEEGKYRI
jgi:cell division transport system ATP-binding protein